MLYYIYLWSRSRHLHPSLGEHGAPRDRERQVEHRVEGIREHLCQRSRRRDVVRGSPHRNVLAGEALGMFPLSQHSDLKTTKKNCGGKKAHRQDDRHYDHDRDLRHHKLIVSSPFATPTVLPCLLSYSTETQHAILVLEKNKKRSCTRVLNHVTLTHPNVLTSVIVYTKLDTVSPTLYRLPLIIKLTHQRAAGWPLLHQLADHVHVCHQRRLQDERHVGRVEQLDGEPPLLAPILLVLDLVSV